MNNQVVHTPALLLAKRLFACLLWMVARLHPSPAGPGTTWLGANTGLTRTTVLAGLARMTAQGWYPNPPAPAAGAGFPIPGPLVTDRRPMHRPESCTASCC